MNNETKWLLQWFKTNENLSLIKSLNINPETHKYYPNQSSRQVKSGHYVSTESTPLRDPYLVTFSLPMATSIGLTSEICKSMPFILMFSGDYNKNNWATPYALSIYGREMYSNCPFKNDTGYGDGRAMSLTEIVIDGNRWELQLKGCGKTPFSRTGDGRAVLRSSVREFLVSEAMFHLNVKTTRALSLLASDTETVLRPWFSNKEQQNIKQKHDIMQQSKCAVLCRAASSFIRVGHLELFSRRVRSSNNDDKIFRLKELELMAEHVIFREYNYLTSIQNLNLQEKIIMMLKNASNKFAKLVADWLRIGYVQGNYNSDNCHVGGITIDYGPFGFMGKFKALWNPWIDGGPKYAFLNQMYANDKNFNSFVDSVLPLLDEQYSELAENIKRNHLVIVIDTCNQMWAEKMGFSEFDENVAMIKYELFELMEMCDADYTLFWRQLANILENNNNNNNDNLFELLNDCFYRELATNEKNKWIVWIKLWLAKITQMAIDNNITTTEIAQKMKRVSPKFVPRDWMLTMASDAANNGDFNVINELQKLFETPYDEHINDNLSNKYYKKEEGYNNHNPKNNGNSFIS